MRTFATPADFDDDALFAFMIAVDGIDAEFRKHNNGHPSSAWRGFAGAAEGVRTRFRTMAESDEGYRAVLPQGAGTHEERYEEERALFVFFSALVSTFECACYMLFATASQLAPTHFKMATDAQLRAIAPKAVLETFQRRYPIESLTTQLDALVSNKLFAQAYTFRNVLSHRGLTPRHYSMNLAIGGPNVELGGPHSTAVATLNGVAMDAQLTAAPRAWFAAWINGTLSIAKTFVQTRPISK